MKLLALGGAALLAVASFASAEIIGVDSFDYPDGEIAGKSGGTFWNFKNVAPAGHTSAPSNWDNLTGLPVVTAGRLVTNDNNTKREYGADGQEGNGAVNGVNVHREVYYRVTVTTGATLPEFFVLSSYDFGNERVVFGKLFNEPNFGLAIVGEAAVNSSVAIQPNTTYTLVAKISYSAQKISLFINPDLSAAEPLPNVSADFTRTEWSTAVRFGSGFTGDSVAWDDLVVATTWDELGTVVTTTADEDNISLDPAAGGGTGVSLREAVKYSPAGHLVTFAPALSGKTIALTQGEIVIDKRLTISGPGADRLIVRRDHNAATEFRIFTIAAGVTNGVAISGMTITGGRTAQGGGIFSRSNLTLTNVHVTGNQAVIGGGVALETADGAFIGCSFSNNRSLPNQSNSGGLGGGIFHEGNGGRRLRIVSATVSGNIAAVGGGIYHNIRNSGGNSRLEIVNSTVTNNTALITGAGCIVTATQNSAANTATTTLRNTIIANNTPTNLQVALNSTGGAATFQTLGFNLSDNFNGVFTPAATDITNPTPRLGPLSLGGGTTPTHALIPGSPALNAGDPSGLLTDQRGQPRVFGAQADIGAVEMRPIIPVQNINNGGIGSLRQAIIDSNGIGDLTDILDIFADGGVVNTTLRSTIIAGNTPTNLVRGQENGGAATFQTLGSNLSDNFNGVLTPAATDITSATPFLARLGDYGGPTPTVALKAGSPARNASTGSATITDQRGFPIVGVPDIGAYEAGTLTNYNAFSWETLPASATDEQRAATFDFDADSATNGDEYVAGTDATDLTSHFRVLGFSLVGPNAELTYSTVLGRRYTVEFTGDLLAQWQTIPTTFIGTGEPITSTVGPTTGFDNLFYRIRVER